MSLDTLTYVVEIGAYALLCGLFAWAMRRGASKRTDTFARVARAMKWSYSKDGPRLESLGSFELFSKGSSGRARSTMSTDAHGVDTRVFEYVAHLGEAEGVSASVVYFRSDKLRLPAFLLRPEGLADKVAGAVGGRDVDFDSHPIFSRRFTLRGDEPSIRQLFGADVLSYFERIPDLFVEGRGDRMIVYRFNDTTEIDPTLTPDDVRQLLHEGLGVFAQMTGTAGRKCSECGLVNDAQAFACRRCRAPRRVHGDRPTATLAR